MAIDKTKIIQQAQKFIQGQKWDKAIECYEQIAKIEPKDTRVRQKIAELYARKGDIGKALQSYGLVADSYTREGFYQKSLAVYKQMLQIKPDYVPAYEQLAEVSIKLGLTSDAINFIKVVIAQHEKDGKVLEALDAIKKLIEIDPSNLASQIKLAELYAREGHQEDAVNQLAGLISQFEESEDWESLLRVRERICHYDPQNHEHLKAYYKLLLKQGRYQPAFQPLQRYIKLNREDLEAIEDLAALLRQLGNGNHEKVALKELARRLGENADPRRLEEIYTRILEIDPNDQAAAEYLDALRAEMTTDVEDDHAAHTDEVDIASEEMIGGEEEELVGEEEEAAPSEDELVDEDVEIAGQEQIDTMLIGAAHGGDIQDDQIDAYLTEADVYVKYGLIDKGVTHLQKLIASRPDCVPAYAKLREVLNAGSRGGEFPAVVKSAIELLKKKGKDTAALQALLGGPQAAPAAARAAPPPPPGAGDIDPDIAAVVAETRGIDEEISDELASAVGGALDATLGGETAAPPAADDHHDVSIEIDIDEAHAAAAPPPASLEAEAIDVAPEAESNPLAGADLDSDLSFSTPEPPPPLAVEEHRPPVPPPSLEVDMEGGSELLGEAPPPAAAAAKAPPATLEAEEELASGPPPEFDEATLGAAEPAPVTAKAPAPVRPAVTPPTIAKPSIAKPTITPPSIAKPVISKPVIGKPSAVPHAATPAAKPSITPPAIAKPSIAKPTITPPSVAKPAAPAIGKPAIPAPALAKPGLTPPGARPALKPPLAAPKPLATPSLAAKPALAPKPGLTPPGAKPALPRLAPLPKPGLGLPKTPLAAPKPPSLKPLPSLHVPPKLAGVAKEKFAEDFEQVEFELQQGLYDEARVTLDMILAQDPDNAKAKSKLNELIAAEKTSREESSGTFTPEFGDGEQVSVDAVLKAFQQGVDKTVAKEDSQTRFDLGLAYREMGLFGEAEREFRLALDGNNARRPDCWTMIGLCQLEGGDPAAAAATFEQGLTDTADPEPRYNLAYELANARMSAGDKAAALGLLSWIETEKPGFRQTSELISQLRSEGVSGGPTPPPPPDQGPAGSRANVSYV